MTNGHIPACVNYYANFLLVSSKFLVLYIITYKHMQMIIPIEHKLKYMYTFLTFAQFSNNDCHSLHYEESQNVNFLALGHCLFELT